MTAEESKVRTRKIAFAVAVLFVLVLNGPALYSFAIQRVTPKSEIPYDEILPLSASTGLAMPLDYSHAGEPIKQYVPGLNALYYDLDSIQKDTRKLRIDMSKDETAFLGSNITIIPWLTDSKTNMIAAWMVPLVFLVDPEGEVRASYPPGNIPFGTVSDYPTLSSDVSDALNKGRLAFTYDIPSEPSSLGTWMIVVLYTDYTPGGLTSIVAGTKAWFEVIKAPKPLSESPIDLLRVILSMWVAPFTTVFAILSTEGTKRFAILLARNWIFIIGIVALFVAFYLSYLTP
jgi:hypothetical protein